MSIKFTSPKKELSELIVQLRYARETSETVTLPLLAGLFAVTLRHAAAKGVIAGTFPDPYFEGAGRNGRPWGWRFRGQANHPVPGADVRVPVVVNMPRDEKGRFQWEKVSTPVFDSRRIVSRTGQYRKELLAAADDLDAGNYEFFSSGEYGSRKTAYLSVGKTSIGTGLVFELEGIWAMLEGPTANAPRGRRVIGQRLRNNRKALTRLLEQGNPWGLGQGRKKWDGWTPKKIPSAGYGAIARAEGE
jgi:hypothetical protein